MAKEAGNSTGGTGAVTVNRRQQPAVDGIWAAGDCAEAFHRVSQRAVNIHLGTIANKQGRVAGINMAAGNMPPSPVCWAQRLQGLRPGDRPYWPHRSRGTRSGLGVPRSHMESTTTAGYWPEAESMCIKLLSRAPQRSASVGSPDCGGAREPGSVLMSLPRLCGTICGPR